MKVVVFVAGTNRPGNSDFLADRFIEGMRQHGDIEVEKLRLNDLRIGHFNVGYYEPGADQGEDFQRVQRTIERSHGFVIATPVWNFSVPAHLKNLIDRMGAFALDESRSQGTLSGRPFFLIFTGGAPDPAWKALMRRTTSHLPEALQYFGASYIGHHFEGGCTIGRGKFGLVVDQRPESIERVRQQGCDFAKVVAEYERTGKAPIQRRARARLAKWAEGILRSRRGRARTDRKIA